MPKTPKPLNEALDEFVETLIQETFQDIVSERFKRYSKYIIQERALPDARDGLKPVQRRILYAMHQMRLFHDQSYKKSARIAGDVMGKYHPHGESSIYDAMVRMSQDFKMYQPLVDMHGNNGSIDGDSAAAMRYTEARLSLSAEFLLKDIDSKTVPFIPNYDDEEVEPTVLPAKFPNLLVNGATGISAGYATKIPPHNLHEVIQATIALIKNEHATTLELMKYMKGPDFPTGGLVQGKEGIFQALDTGSGKIVIRSEYHIEEIKKDQVRIVIDSIPYDLNKAELVRAIDQLRINKKFEDIVEIRDESDKDGLRIAIDLKKGKEFELAINYLFKHTDLQMSYHYNMVAILNHRPVQVGIIPILKTYIHHQKEVVINRSHYLLKKAETRLHIVVGLIKMVDVLSEIIELIRASKNKQSAKESIIKAFQFSDVQAEAIVMLQLYRLSNTDILQLQQESEQLNKDIALYQSILNSDDVLSQVIIDELKAVDKQLSLPRRSKIEEVIETIKIDEKDLIQDEQVMIGLTRDGYIKRSNMKSYQMSQQVALKTDDVMIYEHAHQTLDTLLLFTNLGNFIYLPVYKLDDQKWKDLGVYIHNIVPLEDHEIIIDILSVKDFNTNQAVILVTALGQIKHVKLKEFEMVRYQKTTKAIQLDDHDSLAAVTLGEGPYVTLVSELGMMITYSRDDIPFYGLSARGVKGMELSPQDSVTALSTYYQDDELYIVTSRGHMITLSPTKLSKRGRKGIEVIEPLKSQPHIPLKMFSSHSVNDDTLFYVYTNAMRHECLVKNYISRGNKYGKFLLDNKQEFIQHVKLSHAFVDTYMDELSNRPITMEPKLPSEPKKTKVISNVQIDKEVDPVTEKSVNEEESTSKNKQLEAIKKSTVTLNRLSLFDDEDGE